MARALSFQRPVSGLLTLILTFAITAPGLWLVHTPRASAATYTVTNTSDSGAGSLRQAITDANANLGADIITATAAGTVTLASGLPDVTEQVEIDFTSVTQAGSNLVISGADHDYCLRFTGGSGHIIKGLGTVDCTFGFAFESGVTGATLGGTSSEANIEISSASWAGVYVNGASNITIMNTSSNNNLVGLYSTNSASNLNIDGQSSRNMFSNNAENGIEIENTSTVTITGSYVGLDSGGTMDLGNSESGIYIGTGVTNANIGGLTSGARNVISGNTVNGIHLNSNGVIVNGNYIGTNAAGASAISNGTGIKIESSSNTIGASSSGRNVISGSTADGIHISSATRTANANIIKHNYIGITADGTLDLGNSFRGIFIEDAVLNTVIGGAGEGNVISGNNSSGISITGSNATGTSILGNTIGLNAAGTGNLGNTLEGIYISGNNTTVGQANSNTARNTISANGGNGISINGASGAEIVNNYFGTNTSGSSSGINPNTENNIELMTNAASNSIGGVDTGAGNTFVTASNKYSISLVTNAGNYNDVRRNTFNTSSVYVNRAGTSNEALSAPTITSAIQDSPSTTTVTGTAPASSSVEIYIDGVYIDTAGADGTGAYSKTVTSIGTTVTVVATNTSNSSTSSTNGATTIDTTAPSAPSLSYNSTGSAGSTVNINGTGEVNANVYVNGVDSTADVAGDGSFTVTETLIEGVNTFSITLVDRMSNTSAATVATISAVSSESSSSSGGAAFFPSRDSDADADVESSDEPEVETGNVVDPDSQEVLETGSSSEPTESMAGDEEVVETPSQTIPTTETSSSSTSSSSGSSSGSTKPTKSFVQTIYEIIKPIEVQSVRDTLPETPAFEAPLSQAMKSITVFGSSKNAYGIPEEIVKAKLGDKDLSQDADGDGLTNGEELLYFSNPFVQDTDEDGVDDVHEVFLTGTDPSTYDSDRDGLSDTLDAEPLTYNNPEDRVNPKEITAYIAEKGITSSLGMIDSDQDGLADLMEFYLSTDPQNSDSDADGLNDGDEYNHYGTDPNLSTSSAQIGGIRISSNTREEEVVAGEQFFMGQASAGAAIHFYDIGEEGELTLIGETESDDFGRYNLLTTEGLKAGTHTVFALVGDLKNPLDISAPRILNARSYVSKPDYVSLNLPDGATVTKKKPSLDLRAADDYMVIVSWRSSIYSQVLIADASEQTLYAEPIENLELGDHTVTWYAVDPENNHKSEPTRIAFTIGNAAFVNGENGANLWTVVLGSIAVLASLTAMGLYFRKGKYSPRS